MPSARFRARPRAAPSIDSTAPLSGAPARAVPHAGFCRQFGAADLNVEAGVTADLAGAVAVHDGRVEQDALRECLAAVHDAVPDRRNRLPGKA
jgi:hypothetical protein